jgi:hypothetical protein
MSGNRPYRGGSMLGADCSWRRIAVAQDFPAGDRGHAPPDRGQIDHRNLSRCPGGFPHIRAGNQLDVYFALGFVHAQDRLWQMEIMRRAVSGSLAELAGARLVPRDRAMPTLGLALLDRDLA